MLAIIIDPLHSHNFPIFQPILMILVSNSMVHRAISDKTYLLFGLHPFKGKPVKFRCFCSLTIEHFKSVLHEAVISMACTKELLRMALSRDIILANLVKVNKMMVHSK